jgi:hypothetical protein
MPNKSEITGLQRLINTVSAGTKEDPVAKAIRRIYDSLFNKQKAVIDDPQSFIVACCSRRSGKSELIARWLLLEALRNPGKEMIYFAQSAKSARELLWSNPATGLPSLIKKLDLQDFCQLNETKTTVMLNNSSLITLTGAETKTDCSKWLGHQPKLVTVDESQDIPDDVLVYLLRTVIMPSLKDNAGKLFIAGTPKESCSGFFYEATVGKSTAWSRHHWDVFQNPFMPNVMELIDEELEKFGERFEDAGPQRRYRGKWVQEEAVQLFSYKRERNDFTELPYKDKSGNFINWRYTLGIDVGRRDLTTFTVLAWTDKLPVTYCLESYGKPKMLDTELAKIIKDYQAKYAKIAIVADRGALGDFIFASLEDRYGFYIEPAEKKEKAATIRLMNTEFRLARILINPNTCKELLDQLLRLEIDPETQIEKKSAPCDFADSMLYAWRHTYSYIYKSPGPKPNERESWVNREKALLKKTIEEETRDPQENLDKEMDSYFVDPWTTDFF